MTPLFSSNGKTQIIETPAIRYCSQLHVKNKQNIYEKFQSTIFLAIKGPFFAYAGSYLTLKSETNFEIS